MATLVFSVEADRPNQVAAALRRNSNVTTVDVEGGLVFGGAEVSEVNLDKTLGFLLDIESLGADRLHSVSLFDLPTEDVTPTAGYLATLGGVKTAFQESTNFQVILGLADMHVVYQ